MLQVWICLGPHIFLFERTSIFDIYKEGFFFLHPCIFFFFCCQKSRNTSSGHKSSLFNKYIILSHILNSTVPQSNNIDNPKSLLLLSTCEERLGVQAWHWSLIKNGADIWEIITSRERQSFERSIWLFNNRRYTKRETRGTRGFSKKCSSP